MMVHVKRIREGLTAQDGYRIYVDRFYPRGITKEEFDVDIWDKQITPTAALTKWYHEDREGRYDEFAKRYHQELLENPHADEFITMLKQHQLDTLVTDVHDIDHSHIPTLMSFIQQRM